MLSTLLSTVSSAFSGATTYIYVGVAVLVVSLVGGLYYLHTVDQATILNQAANIATLNSAVTTQQTTINSLQADAAAAVKATQQNELAAQSARKTLENTRVQIHKLQSQLKINPQQTEKDANSNAARTLNCISILSGATANDLGLDVKGYTDAKTSCN